MLAKQEAMMSFSKALAQEIDAAIFRKDEKGRTVFSPASLSGKGAVWPDAETEARIRRLMRRGKRVGAVLGGVVFLGASLLAVLLYGDPHAWPIETDVKLWGIGLLSVFAAVVGGQEFAWRRIDHLVKDLPLSNGGVGLREASTTQPRAMLTWPTTFLLLLATLELWFVSSSTGSDKTWWLVAAGVPLCVLCYFASAMFKRR
jgi:hypothetical protein